MQELKLGVDLSMAEEPSAGHRGAVDAGVTHGHGPGYPSCPGRAGPDAVSTIGSRLGPPGTVCQLMSATCPRETSRA